MLVPSSVSCSNVLRCAVPTKVCMHKDSIETDEGGGGHERTSA